MEQFAEIGRSWFLFGVIEDFSDATGAAGRGLLLLVGVVDVQLLSVSLGASVFGEGLARVW